MDWKQLLISGGVGLVSTLIMGSFLRKLVLLGLNHLAKKTENKLDDELVSTIQQDWGVKDLDIDGKNKPDGE